MSKKLGNIPKQEKMTEEQEQVFTNGINKGRKLERKKLIKVIKEHSQTGKSVGGFLGVCTCGEAIDDYQEHLIEKIKESK